MRKSALILAIGLLSFTLKGQIIDNKADLYLCYLTGIFGGSETVNNNGFISPSLYSNFDNHYGVSVKGIILKRKVFDVGASINYLSASGWNNNSYSDFLNSGVVQYSISPLAQIHNKSAEYGFLNRVGFFLEIAPSIGLSKLLLDYSLFEIQNGNTIIDPPPGSNDLFYGLRGGVGIKASVNQVIALFFESSAGYYFINSKMYSDTHFTNYSLEAGIIIKLKKNKRYFY